MNDRAELIHLRLVPSDTAFINSRGQWLYCDDSRIAASEAKEVVVSRSSLPCHRGVNYLLINRRCSFSRENRRMSCTISVSDHRVWKSICISHHNRYTFLHSLRENLRNLFFFFLLASSLVCLLLGSHMYLQPILFPPISFYSLQEVRYRCPSKP